MTSAIISLYRGSKMCSGSGAPGSSTSSSGNNGINWLTVRFYDTGRIVPIFEAFPGHSHLITVTVAYPPTLLTNFHVVLISTYDLGHQPFGLASPAAWFRERGATVDQLDLSQEALGKHEDVVSRADLIGLHLPMHTATRIAAQAIPRLRQLNPRAHLCAYGLYAPLNSDHLHALGVHTIIGGEFEGRLLALAE